MPTKPELEAKLELCDSKNQALEKTIEDYRATTAELEKTVQTLESTKRSLHDLLNERKTELDQLHVVFDAMNIPRKQKPKEAESWHSDVELSLHSRWIYYFHLRENGMLQLSTGARADRY